MWGCGIAAAIALVVRLAIVAIRHDAPIDMDGAEYVRHAQNLLLGFGDVGMRGDADGGPPLFPLAIAALLVLIPDAQLAGEVVAALAGAALTAAVWALAATVYDRRVATIAAGIVAIVPISVALGSQALSETPFLALLVTGLWLLLRALRNARALDAAGCGAALGLAYMSRWQGVAFPLFAAGVLALPSLRARRIPRNALLAFSVALMVALPYLAGEYRVTGHLRLEGESAVNALLADGISRGSSYLAVADALDADGNPVGPEIDPRFAGLRQSPPGPPLRRRIGLALEAIPHHAHDLLAAFAGRDFGVGLLVALALVGLTRSPWTAQRRRDQLVLLAVVLVLFVELASVGHFWPRFAGVFIPFLAIWAANGGVELTAWSRASGLPNAGAAALVAFALLALTIDARDAFDGRDPSERLAGAWVARQANAPLVVDVSDRVAFYAGAGARWSPLPYASPALACRHLAREHADFVVLDSARAVDYPPLAGWFVRGPSCPDLTLAYRVGRLRVYSAQLRPMTRADEP